MITYVSNKEKFTKAIVKRKNVRSHYTTLYAVKNTNNFTLLQRTLRAAKTFQPSVLIQL